MFRVTQKPLGMNTDVIGGGVAIIDIVPGIEFDGEAVRDAAVMNFSTAKYRLWRSGDDQGKAVRTARYLVVNAERKFGHESAYDSLRCIHPCAAVAGPARLHEVQHVRRSVGIDLQYQSIAGGKLWKENRLRLETRWCDEYPHRNRAANGTRGIDGARGKILNARDQIAQCECGGVGEERSYRGAILQ